MATFFPLDWSFNRSINYFSLSADQEAELREQKEAISKLMAKKSLNRSKSPVKEKYANLRNGRYLYRVS